MRCGLVRLVTRRCPYDVKIRRKAWNSSQKGGETGALNEVAESRLIGRYCAHKVCRLVEKSSKLVCRVLSGNNLTSRKLSSTKSPFFDHLSDCDHNQAIIKCSDASARCQDKNLRSRLNLNSAQSQSSKSVQRQQNYSANERDMRNTGKSKPTRPYHVHSKYKCFPYKRYSAHKLASKRNINAYQKRLKNKNIVSKKLYVVQSPFVTYHTNPKESKYLNKLKQCSISPYENLDKSDYAQGFLDHNVLNHLNETSYLSLCGCETCHKKLKQYEKKNNKINLMLQNKISKILNYCKKKNPFYKIYSQGDNQRTDLDMREYGMHGINGWLNYLDSCECTDWNGYKLGKPNICYSNHSTKNKCVNTSNEIGDTNILTTEAEHHKQNCADSNFESRDKDDNLVKQDCSYKNAQSSDLKESETNKQKDQNNVQSEGNFENKDHSTTQTQDYGEAPVTNYYYITNNTLNAKCCCKEECVNENGNCSKFDNKCRSDSKQSKDQNVCQAQENNLNKPDNNEKYSNTAFNTFCKTMNKVYDVMMKPVNENEIFKEDGNNNQDNLKEEIKACNVNNFEYYDSESYQQYNMCFDRGDIQQNSDKNISSQVLNFDEFVDMKFRDMKDEKMCNKFLRYDDLQFKEIAKISSNKEFEKYVLSNTDKNVCLSKNDVMFSRTNKFTDCTTINNSEFKPSKYNSELKEKDLQQLDQFYQNPSGSQNNSVPNGSNLLFRRELGPLDHLNQFISNNSQRYEEKAQILSKGPNFSHFPDSNWRTSLFRCDKKLSETFDVSDPCIINIPIKIETNKTKDLSKYSEINIAIEKVKKKIHDIMNESDEKICVGRDRLLKPNQCNNRVNIPRQGLLKQNEALPNNEMELVNNSNCRAKLDNVNDTDGGKEDNYLIEKQVKNCYYKTEEGRYSEALDQTNHPPSSVHLNEIIEAMKENRNTDKCYNTSATKANKGAIDHKGNKGYRVYGAPLPQSTQRKIPLRNNVFVFKPGTEPIFGTVNTENLVYKANVSRNISTSSKYKPFLGNYKNKTNKEPYRSNFMDGTIFSTDNFISEGWDNENKRKIEKHKSYLKYIENRVKQKEKGNRVFETSAGLPTKEINCNFTTVEYNNHQKNCQEELFKKSLDVFSKNNVTGMERLKKSEYSPLPAIPGVLNRYSVKISNERDVYNRNESNMNKKANEKRWKIWDPKDWENEGDNCHAEMISKGFCDTGRTDDVNCKSPKENEIIFNERLEKTVQTESGLHDNCTGTKAVMNDTGRRFDPFNYRPNNRSGVDNSYCINVGDLGLNFTSFSLEKSDERENKKRKGSVVRGEYLEKSVYGSESRINNAGVTNTSMSRQADLHLREIRTVGLRPCNKNEVPHNSFRIRNSFLMDAKNSLRPVTTANTLNKRQASSGILDGAGFKSNMSDKLKNLERIDQVDYLKEEKYMSNKEAIETIRVKESYVSPLNKNENSFDVQISSENKCLGLGMCSKEVEKRTKNRAIGDTDVTKQITEEINVFGLFPEGKKTVHGKIVSVLTKPKNLFTTLKSRNKESEAIKTSDFKEPITVQVIYETTTDHSVGEHIDKAKRKVYVGDIKRRARTPVKLFNNNDYKIEIENPKQQTEQIITNELKNEDNDIEENESYENKSPVWKKYDPKNNGLDSKKYYVELKKLMKNKKMNTSDVISEDKKSSKGEVINWQAPRNVVYDKLVNRDGVENEWVQDKGINSAQTNANNSSKEKEINVTTVSKDSKEEMKSEKEMNFQSMNQTSTSTNQRSTDKQKRGHIEQNINEKEKISSEEPNNEKPVPTNKIYDEEESSVKINVTDDDNVKKDTLENKLDKPTSGEDKYEIDSDSLDKGSDNSIENEKLVITHFKQFHRPEESTDSLHKLNQNNFILEASMLKVTLVHDKSVEIQSIESLSNDVEKELNDMVSPYIKDMVINGAPRETKRITRKAKVQFKPNEYFLNMINSKQSTQNMDKKEASKERVVQERQETGVNKDKIEATEGTEKDREMTDLTHVLRSSIEKIYMKKVSYPTVLSTNDQIRPAEKLPYKEGEKEEFKISKNQQRDSKTSMENISTREQSSSTSEKEVTNNDQDGVFSQISKELSSKDPEIKTDEFNEISENTDTLEQQEPKRAPARYDSIVKELKQMFVKGESKTLPQNQQEMRTNKEISGKSSNESIEKDVKSELKTPQVDNKLSEQITKEAQGVIKEQKNVEEEITIKSLDSASFTPEGSRNETSMPLDIITKIPDPKKEISADNEINIKTKPKTKSTYKSYESTIKPKLFGKRKSLEKIVKGSKAIFKKERKENDITTKSKIPIAKPKPSEARKATYKSFYSYDSSIKPSVHKQEVEGASKSIEAEVENKTKMDKQEETKIERGEQLVKAFAARKEMLIEEEFDDSHDRKKTPKEQTKSITPDIEENEIPKTKEEDISIKDYVKQVILVDNTDLVQPEPKMTKPKDASNVVEKPTTKDSRKPSKYNDREELQKVLSKKESIEDIFVKPSSATDNEKEIQITDIASESTKAMDEIMSSLPEIKIKPLKEEEEIKTTKLKAAAKAEKEVKTESLKEELQSAATSPLESDFKEEMKTKPFKEEHEVKNKISPKLPEMKTTKSTALTKAESEIKTKPFKEEMNSTSTAKLESDFKEVETKTLKEGTKLTAAFIEESQIKAKSAGEKKFISAEELRGRDVSNTEILEEDKFTTKIPKHASTSFYSYDSTIKSVAHKEEKQETESGTKESTKTKVDDTTKIDNRDEIKALSKMQSVVLKDSIIKDNIKNKKIIQEKPKIKESVKNAQDTKKFQKTISSKKETKEDMFIKPSSATDDETHISKITAEASKVIQEIIPRLSEVIPKALKEESNTSSGASKKESEVKKEEKNIKSKNEFMQKISWKKSNVKDNTVKDSVEDKYDLLDDNKLEKTSNIQSKAQVEKKAEPLEEEFEIMASSFSQYEEREREEKGADAAGDRTTYERDDSAQIEKKKDKTRKIGEKRVTPLQEAKHFMPYERERTEQELELEAWEKQPTYLKNLRPAFYKIKRVEMRHRNYEDNEKKFKDMKMLNKIASMNKVADCTCKKGEKWVADMCCSLEEGKENSKQASEVVEESLNTEESVKNQPIKGNVVRSGRGYRSTDWPDNLSRKKDAVIKQPLTPRPPWRN